jgi:CheY-like chemotaxis protein
MTPVPQILLAEADVCLARSLLHCLEKLNPPPQIVHVPDSAGAIDRLQGRRMPPASLPSVVILNLKMPGIGGLEVLRWIRRDGRLRLLPVVMLTSSPNDRDLRACYESGANACVLKPIGFHQLMAVTRQLGIFWTQINRSPPSTERASSPTRKPAHRDPADPK